MQFCFFCALYYGAIAFGVVFLEILIQMLLLLYTNLETTLFFSSRCVTTGGSRILIKFLITQVTLFVSIHYTFVQY